MTCYNLAPYIAAAIQSVLDQDFDGDIELIVVDDCSTDSSAEVIRSFSGVRYVKTSANAGVLLATLAGIDAATADILFFLDGDDLWHRSKLTKVMPSFARPNVGFVTHDLRYIDAAGRDLDRKSRPSAVLCDVPEAEVGEKLRTGILEIGDFVWLGSAFAVRKPAADGFAAFVQTLPDAANTYQDWPLAYWIAAQPDVELDYVPGKLFSYRLHESNHSGDATTPERAIRNLTRTLNTNRAIQGIARMRGLSPHILRIIGDRIAYCEYRIDLERGRRGRALSGFVRNAADLGRRRVLAKEALRFLGVQILGPEKFSRVAAKRTVLRGLPVS